MIRIRQHKPVYIFDIDGTLSNRGERDPYDLSKVGEDQPIQPVLNIVNALQDQYIILIVSGRNETSRLQTDIWLKMHGIRYTELFMRPEDDFRADYEVKKDIFHKQIKPYHSQIIGVFDDRLSVIHNCWFELGLFVFNVNNNRGEF